MSNDLVQWLHAQLDEDERMALAAGAQEVQGHGPQLAWRAEQRPAEGASGPRQAVVTARFQLVGSEPNPWDINAAMAQVTHMAEHDPARVLREIDAKRALLRRANGGVDQPHTHPGEHDADHLRRHHDDGLLRLLALPYTERSGYREEWRP